MKLHRELIPAAAGSGIAPCPAAVKDAKNKMPEVQDIKHAGPVLKHKQSKTENFHV